MIVPGRSPSPCRKEPLLHGVGVGVDDNDGAKLP
jgi:hypothetical protein